MRKVLAMLFVLAQALVLPGTAAAQPDAAAPIGLGQPLTPEELARYAITHRISTPKKLEGFALDGYTFDAGASEPDRLVFRRRPG